MCPSGAYEGIYLTHLLFIIIIVVSTLKHRHVELKMLLIHQILPYQTWHFGGRKPLKMASSSSQKTAHQYVFTM